MFSVTHPFFDYPCPKSKDHFKTEPVGSDWFGLGLDRVHMPSFRRSLAATLNPPLDAGFCLEKILEPKPTAEFEEVDLEHYKELLRQPCFL